MNVQVLEAADVLPKQRKKSKGHYLEPHRKITPGKRFKESHILRCVKSIPKSIYLRKCLKLSLLIPSKSII